MSRPGLFSGLQTAIDPNYRPSRPARVCVASYEILGPSRNGGIGTFCYSLAKTLSAAGHQVTLLYLFGQYCEEGSALRWVSHFQDLGIEFVALPASWRLIGGSQSVGISYDAYQWLRTRDFDVVHFPELLGHGYYTALAKHQGLDFAHTTICVGAHSPIRWIREINREAPHSSDELQIDFLERQSVRLADVLISPSEYLLRWMLANGWNLPAKCYVQQYLVSPDLQRSWEQRRPIAGRVPASELVFFGRLEERKGLTLLCDALDRLCREHPSIAVTFMGKSAKVAGQDATAYIADRSRQWPFVPKILTDHDQQGALQYLHGGSGRLAIISSLEDNLPNTVLECLCERIPFIASRSGGIPEMIATDCIEHVTFEPDPDHLTARLSDALREGVYPAEFAVDPALSRETWLNWHAMLAGYNDSTQVGQSHTNGRRRSPKVSVCLSCFRRSELLPSSAAALEAQEWPNLELIVVNNRAAQPEEASELLRSKGWRVVGDGGTQVGSARDLAAAQATGDYLLFVDERCLVKPDEVATFVLAAEHSHADILTCFLELFSDAGGPGLGPFIGYYPFLGPAIVPSIFRNCFGEGTIFISREAFQRYRRFRGDAPEKHNDWEFLAKAVLMGLRLEVVPRALSYFRQTDASNLLGDLDYFDHVRSLAPYSDFVPDMLRDLPQAALVRQYVIRDDELLRMTEERLKASGHSKVANLLQDWREYSAMRANLPANRWERAAYISRLLLQRRYHRFSHGFGSALRDLRGKGRG